MRIIQAIDIYDKLKRVSRFTNSTMKSRRLHETIT